MKLNAVKVHPSKALLKREDQLAWKMAGVAVDKVAVEKPVQEMIINRIIDNASVAIAAINRRPVVSARGMALGHAKKAGIRREICHHGFPGMGGLGERHRRARIGYARYFPRRRLLSPRR